MSTLVQALSIKPRPCRMLTDLIAGKKHLLPTSTRIAAADV